MNKERKPVSRRTVLKGAAAATAASTLTIVKAESVRGSAANSMIEVGFIGCGGQGARDATLLEATGKAKIVSMADYFQDQLDKARSQFNVDAKRAHAGIDAYKEVIGSKVDAVLLATPPGFRPEHFRLAVNAGKHVFAEKPLAVDVPGCHIVLEAGEKARAQNLNVVVGLQRRYSKAYRACKKLIDEGAIGAPILAHAAWDTRDIWPDRRGKRSDWKSQMDYEVRYWYFFKWLSGDHILDQNMHNMDVINWMLGAHPICAAGVTARYNKRGFGDINDHFVIAFEFASGALSSNTCVQVDGMKREVSETVRGTKGLFHATDGKDGTGRARIEGSPPKRGAEAPILYKYEGSDDRYYDQEAAAFVAAVSGRGEGEDKYRNDTRHGVEATFTAILGREAAYRKETLRWNEFWNDNKKLTFKAES